MTVLWAELASMKSGAYSARVGISRQESVGETAVARRLYIRFRLPSEAEKLLGVHGRALVFEQRDPSFGGWAAHDRPYQILVQVDAAGYRGRASAFVLGVRPQLFAGKAMRALEDEQRGVAAQRLDRGQQIGRGMSARKEFFGHRQSIFVVRSGEAVGEIRLEFSAQRRVGCRVGEKVIDRDAQPEKTILDTRAARERAEKRQRADGDLGSQKRRSVCDRGCHRNSAISLTEY